MMNENTYDNWKMAFFPAVLMTAWYLLQRGDGSLVPSVTVGAIYGMLAADGAFFAIGRKGIRASVGSVTSMLFWNLIGCILATMPAAIWKPDILPMMEWSLPMVFGLSVLCGILETMAHRSGSPWAAMLIGTVIVSYKLPAIILAVPSVIRMEPGDGTLTMLLVIAGNLIGAGVWASVHKLPKK